MIIVPRRGPKPDEEGDYAIRDNQTGALSRSGPSGTVFNRWSFQRQNTVMRFLGGVWTPQYREQIEYNDWQERRHGHTPAQPAA